MVKKLLKGVREYKRASIFTMVFAGLEVVMEIVVPFLMASIIDQGIYGGNMNTLLKLGLYMVLCVIIGLIFGLVAGGLSAGFAKNLRKDLYFHIQGFSFANIDKFSTAGLVTRLTTDVTNVQNAYQMILRIAIRAPLMLIFSLIMSYTINPTLATIFLIIVPVLGGGLAWLALKSHPIFEEVFHIYDDLNGVVQENISGIRVVKSFVREEHEKNKFQKVSTNLYKKFC